MAGRRSLAAEVAGRLTKAGIRPDDPALVALRAWNREVLARAAGSVLSERERTNGKR